MPSELQQSLGKLTNFSNAVSTSLDELKTKVAEAKKILKDINKLKSQKDFCSREQVEEKKAAIQARVTLSQRLQDEIKSLKSDPGFLSDEDFQLCQNIMEESLLFWILNDHINFKFNFYITTLHWIIVTYFAVLVIQLNIHLVCALPHFSSKA